MRELYNEREARRAYIRRRQIIVFSIVTIFVVVATVVSFLFLYHVNGLGRVKRAAVEPNYGVTAPCSPVSEEGERSHYIDNSTITIRVLNGTNFPGLARAVSQAMQDRKFNVQGVDNFDGDTVQRTTIYFGKNAIAQAYTVTANFEDAIMQMDDREDALIDVVLGATFSDLKEASQVPGGNAEIQDIEGCVAAEEMTEIPAAIEHEAVEVTTE